MMTPAKSLFNPELQHKIDMLVVLINRANEIDETDFLYWLEELPDELVAKWEREKVHPTKLQIKEHLIHKGSINVAIKKLCEEILILCEKPQI